MKFFTFIAPLAFLATVIAEPMPASLNNNLEVRAPEAEPAPVAAPKPVFELEKRAKRKGSSGSSNTSSDAVALLHGGSLKAAGVAVLGSVVVLMV